MKSYLGSGGSVNVSHLTVIIAYLSATESNKQNMF